MNRATSLDLDRLRRWIGSEDEGEELLTAAQVARFEATLDGAGTSDGAGARAEGDEAPQLIHFTVAQPFAPSSALGPDGHPERGGFLPPVPLPRRMWAGGQVEFHAPIRIGEIVSRRSVVEDVRVKRGRSGTLCFVTVRHRVRSGGRDALTERQDIVYREAPDPDAPVAAPAGSGAAPAGRHVRVLRADVASLFRYSALTCNAHRIHYDRDFACGVERYPGLVLHGPLQATLLVRLAAELRGAPLRGFDFRSLSPIFDTAAFRLNAEDAGDELRLWTAQEGGPVAMEARARW